MSYGAMVDMAILTEMDEKEDNDRQKRKRKKGQDGKPFSHRGSSRAYQSQGRGQSASTSSSGQAFSLASVARLP